MITVDFFGGGRICLTKNVASSFIVVMGARLAKMEAPLDGSGGDASLLPPAARAASGMVRRRRLD